MNPAHLDHDALAELAEGLLDDADAASANAHLDDCAECRERSAEIADVSRLLADIPVPPMPADLAARIDEAIRAESMATSSVASIPHHALERRRGKRHLRIFSVAAASVVVLGGGAIAGGMLLNGSLDGDDAASHAPAADRARGEAAEPRLSGGESFTVTRSGTAYRSATLVDQVTGVLHRTASLPRVNRPPASVVGCVDQVTLGAKPVLVDLARHENREVTVIVVPTDGSTWRVVVAGPNCSADAPDMIEENTIPARP